MKIFIASIFGLALSFSLVTPSLAASTRSLEDIALFLGISTETLIEELNSGMNMSEIAQAHGVEATEIRNYINVGRDSAFAKMIKNDRFASGLAEILGITVDQLRELIAQGVGLEGLSEMYDVEIVELKGYVKNALAEAGITTSYEAKNVRETPQMITPDVAQYLQ